MYLRAHLSSSSNCNNEILGEDWLKLNSFTWHLRKNVNNARERGIQSIPRNELRERLVSKDMITEGEDECFGFDASFQ